MSDFVEQNVRSGSADIVDAQAAAWFRRRSFWTWSEVDQAEFDAWLEKTPSHEIAYWRIAGAWSRTERVLALRQPMKPAEQTRRLIFPFAKQTVAGLAFAALAGFVTWPYLAAPSEQVFQTSIGGRKVLTFGDGTTIELNTNTVLRTQITAKRRTAELVKGEAYFKVRHNEKEPFVVTAAGQRITDLGTEFSIRTGAGSARVSLFAGRAEIQSDKATSAAHSAVLMPGDVAVATATSISVTRKSVADLRDSAAWRQGLLVFRYTTLRDAVSEVNRYNAEKLVIADESVASRTVYGTVPTQSIEGFVRVAKSALGLHVEKRGSEYVISR